MTHTPISAALYLRERGYTIHSRRNGETSPQPDTIRRWCKRGELPARQVGRTWLIEEAVLDQLLARAGP